jgi:hypothetical protein
MTALEWAAKSSETVVILRRPSCPAARNGDWRAAEALMNRIYGKPEQALITVAPPIPRWR